MEWLNTTAWCIALPWRSTPLPLPAIRIRVAVDERPVSLVTTGMLHVSPISNNFFISRVVLKANVSSFTPGIWLDGPPVIGSRWNVSSPSRIFRMNRPTLYPSDLCYLIKRLQNQNLNARKNNLCCFYCRLPVKPCLHLQVALWSSQVPCPLQSSGHLGVSIKIYGIC